LFTLIIKERKQWENNATFLATTILDRLDKTKYYSRERNNLYGTLKYASAKITGKIFKTKCFKTTKATVTR
jgi:hypothetical protein